jgi:hypothetical protein
VKVLGRRFDIRIMEEVGETKSVEWNNGKSGAGWPENQSSRASGDGVSFQAVAEGFSETGSDVDVSDSCQVLLGLEAQGIRRLGIDGSTRVLGCTDFDMAEKIPNKLGNLVDLSVTMVNIDCDKRVDDTAESEEKVLRLGGVITGVDGGGQEDEVFDLGVRIEGLEEVVEDVDLEDPVSTIGPAHQINTCSNVANSDGGVCEELVGGRVEPKILKDQKG